MDWTGGTRRRYAATRGNGVLQKQKAHFAKARANHPPADSPGQATQWRIPSIVESNRHRSVAGTQSGEHRLERPMVGEREHQRSSRLPETSIRQRNASIGAGEADTATHYQITASQDNVPARALPNASPGGTLANAVIEDEEILLLANRRKLLAQSDWLKLAPTKPLRMNFPAAGERDCIGRRRKISKSGSQRAKPARRRLVTPIYEDRMPSLEPYMHGALQHQDEKDSIKIKIGTDAFASQTAASRRPSEHGDQQSRQASLQFYAQSDDSMLLGMDADVFDADQVDIPPRPIKRTGADIEDSVYAQAGSQVVLPQFIGITSSEADSQQLSQDHHNVTLQSNISPTLQQQPKSTQQAGLFPHKQVTMTGAPRDPLDSIVAGVLQLQSELRDQPNEISEPRTGESSGDTPWRRMLGVPSRYNDAVSRLALVSSSDHIATSVTEARPQVVQSHRLPALHTSTDPPETVVDHDEHSTAWENMLGLRTAHLSQLSGRALHSESLHEDNSSRTELLQPGNLDVPQPYSGDSISTPYGAGTQIAMPTIATTRLERNVSDTTLCGSPSESLQQIRAMAAQPARETVPEGSPRNIDDDDEADAIWRRFVVGSQSSESSACNDGGSMYMNEGDDHLQYDAADDGTHFATTAATQGTSLFVTGRTSSIAPPGNVDDADVSNLATMHQSSEGISSMEVEQDEIEDIDTSPQISNRPANIHAPPVRTLLDPRRFKREVSSRPQARRMPTGHVTSRPMRRHTVKRKDRSVYDLVDRDGMSLAS